MAWRAEDERHRVAGISNKLYLVSSLDLTTKSWQRFDNSRE